MVGKIEAGLERYHDVGLGEHVVGEFGWGLVGAVHARFGQRGEGYVADFVIRVETGRQYVNLIAAS